VSDRSLSAEPAGVPGGKTNLLIALASLQIGGAEVVVQRLAQTLDRRRFNVAICCIKAGGAIREELARDGIDVVVLSDSGSKRNNYLSFLRLLKVIRRQDIHIVHTHTTDALVDAAICKLLRPSLTLIHTFHFGNYPYRRKRTLWMERIFCRFADGLVAVGEVQRRQIRSVHGVRDIERVWNGVSYTPGRGDDSLRKRANAEHQMLIGTTATLTDQKGLFDLLAVAVQMRDTVPKARFAVVGDGPLREQLEAKRDELGLKDTVYFSGWVRNAGEVALPAFDIFFQPSLWEAMSISLLEAMAARKAIVTTRVGETPHIVENEVDGLLVDPRDVAAMAAALQRLIGDRELRARLGEAAARKVGKDFTVGHMTRGYEQIYLAKSPVAVR
jgi:glycosyltransferase involved in cell wall biosynthesis